MCQDPLLCVFLLSLKFPQDFIVWGILVTFALPVRNCFSWTFKERGLYKVVNTGGCDRWDHWEPLSRLPSTVCPLGPNDSLPSHKQKRICHLPRSPKVSFLAKAWGCFSYQNGLIAVTVSLFPFPAFFTATSVLPWFCLYSDQPVALSVSCWDCCATPLVAWFKSCFKFLCPGSSRYIWGSVGND